jgi:hypothetical protein
MNNYINVSRTISMKKLFFYLNSAFFILLLAAVPLSAEIRAEGQGLVWARGNGSADIRGSSTVDITGNGLLKVNKDASCELVEGTGEKLITTTGAILYINFDGRAKVSGEDIALEFNGANIVLNAKGTGVGTFKGVGIYVVGLSIGYWHPFEKTIITFTAPPE